MGILKLISLYIGTNKREKPALVIPLVWLTLTCITQGSNDRSKQNRKLKRSKEKFFCVQLSSYNVYVMCLYIVSLGCRNYKMLDAKLMRKKDPY